jgi:hypothetical protein
MTNTARSHPSAGNVCLRYEVRGEQFIGKFIKLPPNHSIDKKRIPPFMVCIASTFIINGSGWICTNLQTMKMDWQTDPWSSDMSSDRSSDKKVETFYTGFRLAT